MTLGRWSIALAIALLYELCPTWMLGAALMAKLLGKIPDLKYRGAVILWLWGFIPLSLALIVVLGLIWTLSALLVMGMRRNPLTISGCVAATAPSIFLGFLGLVLIMPLPYHGLVFGDPPGGYSMRVLAPGLLSLVLLWSIPFGQVLRGDTGSGPAKN